MPIQVIDNFEINTSKPLDNRFVVGSTASGAFYQTRDDIQWKYPGLRIWDLNDSQPYVYDGATWSSEASISTIQGSGDAGYLPKFGTVNSLINSEIFESSGNIIIGTSASYPFANPGKLQVFGIIRSTAGGFYGNGTNLLALNASNVTTGSLDLARLSIAGSSAGNVLIRNASTALWTNSTSLSVGTASALAVTRTLWGQNFNGTANVTGNINVNGSVNNVSNIVFKNNAAPTPGTLNMIWSDNSNLPKTLTIPGWNGTNRTIALLQQAQTFTAVNTFNQHTNFGNSVQVSGTSSFFGKMNVTITETINFPFIGPMVFTTNSLRVVLGGVGVGNDVGNPYIIGFGSENAYTFKDDTKTGMFRIAASLTATQSSIRMLNSTKVQMVLGNNISPTYSTTVEQYSTPGIAMMSILDVFTITSFDLAFIGVPGIPKYVWLGNSPWSSGIAATTLLWTTDIAGTSGSGAGVAAAGIDAVNYDRLISVQTGGRTSAILHLQSPSGTYYQTQIIWRDSQYNMIVPAGRKWKLVAFTNPGGQSVVVDGDTYTVTTAFSSGDDVKVFIYKYGMS